MTETPQARPAGCEQRGQFVLDWHVYDHQGAAFGVTWLPVACAGCRGRFNIAIRKEQELEDIAALDATLQQHECRGGHRRAGLPPVARTAVAAQG